MTTKQQKRMTEFRYNIINSLIAGALVFAGTFADGNISWESICIAVGVAGVVALTKFRDWFRTQNPAPKTYLNFI